jgi:beta-N-acetylhexosaminidase
MRRTYSLIGFLVIVASVLGWFWWHRPDPSLVTEENTIDLPEVVEPAPAPMSLISPEEKIAQLMMVPIDLSATGADNLLHLNWIEERHPGFVVLCGNTLSVFEVENTLNAVDTFFQGAPVPVMIAVDHEGGVVQRFSGEGFTQLPTWASLCAQVTTNQTRSQYLLETFGTSLSELRQVGIDVVLGPVLDVGAPRSPLLSRACSDSFAATVVADAYVTAAEALELMPVIKHFPGIGSATVDTHDQFASIEVTDVEAELFSTFLPEASAVMVGHVGVEGADPNRPCSRSHDCIAVIKEVNPEALIFSDALEMKASLHHPDPDRELSLVEVSRQALIAGVDVLMYGPGLSGSDMERVLQYLANEYRTQAGFAAIVDDRVERVLAIKQQKQSPELAL